MRTTNSSSLQEALRLRLVKATPNTIKWVRAKVSIQAGTHVEAQAEVTQHASPDGRFTILPVGGMKYARDNGVRGNLNNHWRWTGYRLTDLQKRGGDRHHSVKSLKRIAELRLAREAAERSS